MEKNHNQNRGCGDENRRRAPHALDEQAGCGPKGERKRLKSRLNASGGIADRPGNKQRGSIEDVGQRADESAFLYEQELGDERYWRAIAAREEADAIAKRGGRLRRLRAALREAWRVARDGWRLLLGDRSSAWRDHETRLSDEAWRALADTALAPPGGAVNGGAGATDQTASVLVEKPRPEPKLRLQEPRHPLLKTDEHTKLRQARGHLASDEGGKEPAVAMSSTGLPVAALDRGLQPSADDTPPAAPRRRPKM